MVTCHVYNDVRERINETPAVALLRPRQVEKSALALEVGTHVRRSSSTSNPSPTVQSSLTPSAFLAEHGNELVVLDEVHRAPELFQSLRGLIYRGRSTENAPDDSCFSDRPR